MHLKQQNNWLINKIWTAENFQKEAGSGSLYPFIMYWVTKNSAFWLAVLHMHCRLKEHETLFFLN